MRRSARTLTRNLEELSQANPAKLLLKYSWPALVSMSLNALYSVIDRFYIGHGCGDAAMAGMTLAMPVMMLFAAFGVFVGAGHSALLSIRLGGGDRVECEKILGELVAFKLLFFFLLPPLVLLNLDTVLAWCGGQKVEPAALSAAKSYLRLVLFSHLFSHLAFGLSATMRSEGAALQSMTCMIIGFGVNLILDPLFIFGLGMGIEGAAWATNLAMFSSCVYALSFYWRGKSAVRLRWQRLGFYRTIMGRACGIGFAPFLQQLLGSLIAVSLSAAFAHWAVDPKAATLQIASLGVFQGVLILTIMPILGAQQGLQSILGFSWGARDFRRVRETVILGFWVTSVLCVLSCFIQVVPPFPRLLARLFVANDNTKLLEIAAHDLTVSNCMIWCIGLNVVATTYFQSIGRPVAAIVLSTLRQGVCLLPLVWVLPYFLENHTLAIWLALPISDVACCLMTLVPARQHLTFLSKVSTRGEISSRLKQKKSIISN